MSAPLVPLVLTWIAGLLLSERLALGWPHWLALSAIGLAIGIGLARRSPAQGALLAHPPIYGTLLLLALTLGGARGAAHQPRFDQGDLASYNDAGRATIRGTVVKYPEARGATTRYEIAAEAFQQEAGGAWLPVTGRFLVNLAPYPAYQYGDLLDISGEPVTPPVLDDFDYRAFLAHKGIFSLVRNGYGERVASGQGAALFRVLFALRQRAEHTLQLLLPEPHASLMSGILLGIESGIPDEVMEAFNTTGTTHVLVISGSNFAILSAIFLFLGRRLLGEKWGSLLALLGIALYALLVGGDPPVLRAALMGGFAVLALLLGRQGVALNTLALAVLLMTAWQPGQLHDVGFQLSALATLGLILFVPPLTLLADRLLARGGLDPARRGRWLALLSDAVLITLAAQLITTPLIVGTFGRFSLVSLLTNLLILPVQGWLLVSGGLATLAGLLWLPLGQLLAWVPYAGITWTLGVVRWTATFPLASIQLGPLPAWMIWWIYALWGVWILDSRFSISDSTTLTPTAVNPKSKIENRKWLLWGGAALVIGALWWLRGQLPDGRLHLYALAVGQGDALLIVAPDGKQLLVDGGPDPVPLLSQLGDHVPPWDRTLEMVVLTHADADHLGGLPELLDRYRAAQVVESGHAGETALYAAWQATLQGRGIVPLVALPGQRWQLGGGAVLEVLAPEGTPFEELNNNAVVLRLSYGHFCALLTGDIEAEAEARLLRDGALAPCQVLKVAHHGSQTSTTPAFLAAVHPSVALISAGADNRFGHPHAEVVERLVAAGVRILRTDEQGTIHLWTDGRGLWVETGR